MGVSSNAASPMSYPTPPSYGGQSASMSRPTGVTILAILAGLGGLAFLFLGLAVVAVGGSIGGMFTGTVATVVGGVLILFAFIAFATAYGFWKGDSWGWWLGLIYSILEIIGGALSFPVGLVGLLIGILILYYLTRPYVKHWFHEA
jgi:hypothetical protein